MAKPTGAVVVGALYWDVDAISDGTKKAYTYTILLSHQMLEDYCDENKIVQNRIKLSDLFHVSGSSEILSRTYNISFPFNPVSFIDESTASGWTTHTEDANYRASKPTALHPSGSVGLSPTYHLIEGIFDDYLSSTGCVSEVLAIRLEEIADIAYTDNDIEVIHKDTSARSYKADNPCTAWHIMNIIADTYNRITYETNLTHFCIPIFGYDTGVG